MLIESKKPNDKNCLNKYGTTFKMFFCKGLKQHLHHKNDDDNIYDFEKYKCFIYYKGFFNVPPRPTQLHIFQTCHDFPYVRNFGVNKTIEFISSDFLWP
jgi:hypothetical protein